MADTHDTRLGLTGAQAGVWYAQQAAPDSPVFNVGQYTDIPADLDTARFAAAVRTVVAESDALRARVVVDGDRIGQVVGRGVPRELEVVDLTRDGDAGEDGEDNAVGRALDWMRADRERPVDPTSEPLYRFALLRVGPRRWFWFQRFHHIAVDAYAITMMARRVADVYTRLGRDEEVPATRFGALADLVADQADYADSPRFAEDRAYWTDLLADRPEPALLSSALPAPHASFLRSRTTVGPEVAEGLDTLAKASGATWADALVGAFAAYTHRLTGADDVLLGSPSMGRVGSVGLRTPAMVVNVLPLRLRTSSAHTVAEVIDHTAAAQRDLRVHQRYRSEQLRRDLSAVGDRFGLYGPEINVKLFDYTFTFDGVASSTTNLSEGPVDDIAVSVYRPATGGLVLEANANDARYDRQGARARLDGFAHFLGGFARATGTTRVADLDTTDPADAPLVTPAAAQDPPTVTELLSRAAAADPHATALVHGDTRLTRAELTDRVDRLARLLRDATVGPGDVVALALPRSVDLVVALLAVLRAGAAYVPLDPGHPADRIAHVLADARPSLVLADSTTSHRLPEEAEARLLELDADEVRSALDEQLGGALPDPDPRSAAYLIYTSGSTGRPKGVVVEHRSLAALAATQRDHLGRYLPGRARIGHAGSFTFDASWDTLLGLVHGHELHLLDSDLLFDHARLGAHVAEQRLDHLDFTPTYLQGLLDSGELRQPPALITFGGEACPQDLWDRLRALPGTRALNFYGPTENTVDALVCDVRDSAAAVIGRPVAGVRAHVLDAALRPVPHGVPGDLYLAGDQLARGYAGRPDLTAERFVADPYGPPGTRMYRTGDRALVREDGNVAYLGRADGQVQVRGYRVEPGEVDAAARTHPRVAQCATVVRRTPAGAAQLVAYVVADTGTAQGTRPGAEPAAPAENEVREHLAARLPDYMVPARVVTLERLPLNSSGKVDTSALPEPVAAPTGTGADEPASPAERALLGILRDVLGTEIGLHDDFFRWGGDSILAIQAVNRARSAGLALAVRDVFEAPTVAGLAARAGTATDAPRVPDNPVGPVEPTAVTAELLAEGEPRPRFTQSQVLWTPAGITEETLSGALRAVVAHHGALRLRVRDGRMDVLPSKEVRGPAPLTRVDARELSEDSLTERVEREAADAHTRIDLTEGRPLTAVWFDAGPDRMGQLLVQVHHLAVDGVSWRVIGPDLADAVAALSSGRAVELPGAGTSLRRWTRLLQEEARHPGRLAELDHWTEQTDPALHRRLGARDLDPETDVVATRHSLELELDPGLTHQVLTGIGATYRVGAEEVLLTALTLAADQRLLVELEGHGRRELLTAPADLARTVGWLTTSHPVALTPGTDPAHTLKLVKETLRATPGHGLGYGLLRHLNPGTAPRLTGRARPDVLFNYLGRFGAPAAQPWESAPASTRIMLGEDPDQPLTHGLEIGAIAHEGPGGPRLHLTLRWAPGVHDHHGVRALADDLTAALRALAEAAADPGPHTLTPSDLPLLDLEPSRIEQVERAWAQTSGDPAARLAELWPATPLQSGLVFHSLYGSGHDAYTAQSAVRIDGDLDPEGLHRAAALLLDHHPSLRAGFHAEGEDLVQFVPAELRPRWRSVDLSADPDPDAALERLSAEELATPFDLAHPPLLRFTLVRLNPTRHVLVTTDHHTLLDGWSTPLFLRALFSRYAEPDTPAPGTHFRDHLAWLAARDDAAADHAWSTELADLGGPTLLAPEAPTHGGREQRVLNAALTQRETERAAATARDLGVTTNTLVQAAWALVLGAATGRTDVVFGATVSGRPADLPGVESTLGLFINTVPVRVRTEPVTPVAELLTDLQRRQAALSEHHHTGLTRTQELSGYAPLFDTLLVFENFPARDALADQDHGGVRLTDVRIEDATHYPVSLNVFPGRALTLRLCHRPDAVGADEAGALLDRLRAVINRIAARPEQSVAEVPATTRTERDQLLEGFNHTGTAVTAARPCDALADWAAWAPDTTAVVDAEGEHSYADLDAWVEEIAALLRSNGVRPGRVVGVAVPRSVDMLASLLAVQRVGAVYLPLDPEFPADRLAYMLSDSGAVLVLTGGGVEVPAGVTTPVLDLSVAGDRVGGGGGAPCPANPASPDADSVAYVLYTSGSTGRPKGVVISHRNLANFLTDMGQRFPLEQGERWLAVTTVSFDISALELYLPLLFGATVVLADKDTVRDPRLLGELAASSGATIMQATPSLWRSLTEHDPAVLAPLRVLVGGEAVQAPLAALLAENSRGAHNVYGPTETTIWSTTTPLDTSGPVSIGRPMANTRVYVLDAALRPVPTGVTGDLYIAGEGVGLGYHQRFDLTAERFVADPHAGPDRPGSRMYRTGDLARWRDDGTLDFLGRADFQVKVRGFRIELGEIETALLSAPGVAEAVVTAREDETGNAWLAAHVVPATGVVHSPDAPALPEPAPPGDPRTGGSSGPADTAMPPNAPGVTSAPHGAPSPAGTLAPEGAPAPRNTSVPPIAPAPTGASAAPGGASTSASTPEEGGTPAPDGASAPAAAVAAPLSVAGLREHVAALLPDYMVPSAVVLMDALPLTANGKVDRKALPDPGAPVRNGRAPATAREEILCGILADVLGRDTVGPDEDFFTLGGHSLLATRAVSRIRSLLGTDVGVRDLFEAPTAAALARRTEHSTETRPGVTPRSTNRPRRLSHSQHRLWLVDRLHESGGAYNVPLAVRVADPLDTDTLHAAVTDLVGRHEVLRTVIRTDPDQPGTPVPHLLDADAPGLVDVAAEHLGEPLDTALARVTAQPFDLAERPPLRVRLFTGPGTAPGCVLLVVLHHIVADEWSFGPLLDDLDTAYRARADGRTPDWSPQPLQYADYADSRTDWLGTADDPESPLSQRLDHWRRSLAGLPDELALPTDRPRPVTPSHTGGLAQAPVDPELHAALRDLAAAHGVTVFMVVQAAVATLLHRLGAGEDIPLGSPVADRADEGLQNAIGFFLNTLVLRLDLSGRPTFAELLARVREVDLAGFANADAPFDTVVEALRPERSVSRHPLFQTMVSYQRRPEGADRLFGSVTHLVETPLDTAKFDLEFAYVEDPLQGARLALNHSADLFDPPTAQRIADRLVHLLGQVAAAPERNIGAFDVLGNAERDQLLEGFNRTRTVVTAARPCDALADWAGRIPDAVAVEDSGGTHTYASVHERVEEIAALLRGRGVGAGRTVAVAMPRSVDMLASLLAVQRVGGVYLPLDPEFPADRLAYMVADSAAVLVLTGGGVEAPAGGTAPVLDLGNASAEPPAPVGTVTGPVDADSVAYVLYTSGSTGRPKGVVISHRNLANFLTDMGRRFPLEQGERWLAVTTVSFDISALELYLPLLFGATVVLADKDTVRDGVALADLLEGGGIGIMQATPTLWRMLLETKPDVLRELRVLVGGEALPQALADELAAHAPSVTNVYGPTETTIWSTTSPVRTGAPVSIGGPMANTRVYVLDADLQPVPAGVAGDLYIAGEGVGLGYHQRFDLTAERFVADPHASPDRPGSRMYRTGDLARWRSDGTLDFLGRADFQVKVRGFRIEPGEIETAIARVDGVAQAVVTAQEGADGHHRLVAYLTGTGAVPTPDALRAALSARLPAYMVPSAFVHLDSWPLTANGKVDRGALPDPASTASERPAGRAPATDAERALCAVYADILGLDGVGADEDFFALGGDSVLTLRLVGGARRAGWTVTGRQVFRHPVVADLAAVAEPATPPDPEPAAAAPEEPLISLAPGQLDQLESMWRKRR
ncbi:non-ribosomal peptide synthetase [Nocardiopsis sp. L17-MgMaSL7]|uniref:non-ribosomal peptide synthetase n=1 Tax=Nocardiopsis sp. L17-MgMaSL7 TaxID=1938893 RepID=UPI000D70DF34|nr:non-ribosomal peptide synthetase [Nocardiopsis sp. L17-MgMaSL7]PWV47942.1 non-ribosomal peptide synthase protein (TIGR01720 family)/amino acid adenylation domain-containing protein [Nocardiopsis sp. L17-MgMaSL7]